PPDRQRIGARPRRHSSTPARTRSSPTPLRAPSGRSGLPTTTMASAGPSRSRTSSGRLNSFSARRAARELWFPAATDRELHDKRSTRMRPSTRALAILSLSLVAAASACAGDSDDGGGDGPPGTPGVHYFPNGSVLYQDISDAPVRGDSADTIAYLESMGGWGTGELRIDFSLEVLTADDGAPMRSFTPTDNHYAPDCDELAVPVPPGG